MRTHDHAIDCDIVDISSTDYTVTPPCQGISFATAGDLVLVMANGESKTIPSGALAAGVIHPVGVKQVTRSGTTAADIVVWRTKA